MGGQRRECRGGLSVTRRVVAHVDVEGVVGVLVVVVAKGMTDGDGTAVRHGVPDIVTSPIAVVLARIHGLDHVLSVRSVVRLNDGGVGGCRGRE